MAKETKTEEKVLTNWTLGYARTKDGKFTLFKIQYNPETLEVGDKAEIICKENFRASVEDRFRIESVKKGIFT